MVNSVPDIPGEQAPPEIQQQLSVLLSKLCGVPGHRPRFPGSQPISFTAEHLQLLEKKDFWVCEKSDGLRLLIYILMNGNGQQEVWLVDRRERFFRVADLHFPHHEDPNLPLRDTVIDGELILDTNKQTGEVTLRYYAFDCLAVNGIRVTDKNIVKRYARLRDWVVSPFQKGVSNIAEWRDVLPFEIIAKEQARSYGVPDVLRATKKLEHGHDGLIFTCAESNYVIGTDEQILKWKPASENSIDFKMILRFPPSSHDPNVPDFTTKPAFLLHTWLGGNGPNSHEFFDCMDVSDEEWNLMKDSGEQYDDRIVEVVWDAGRETWRHLRFRDDKQNANHKSVMEKILVSIRDGVEEGALLARADAIRSAWKLREAQAQGKAPAQPMQVRQPEEDRNSAYNAPVAAGGLSGLRR